MLTSCSPQQNKNNHNNWRTSYWDMVLRFATVWKKVSNSDSSFYKNGPKWVYTNRRL